MTQVNHINYFIEKKTMFGMRAEMLKSQNPPVSIISKQEIWDLHVHVYNFNLQLTYYTLSP